MQIFLGKGMIELLFFRKNPLMFLLLNPIRFKWLVDCNSITPYCIDCASCKKFVGSESAICCKIIETVAKGC